MKKKRIYLDTSVISALSDIRIPERQKQTKEFFKKSLPDYEVFVSDIVINELYATQNKDLQEAFFNTIRDFEILKASQETTDLAKEYISRNIIPSKHFEDAAHIAIATIGEINYLVSWNFKHMVKARTRELVMLTNSLLGYPVLDIVAPPEL